MGGCWTHCATWGRWVKYLWDCLRSFFLDKSAENDISRGVTTARKSTTAPTTEGPRFVVAIKTADDVFLSCCINNRKISHKCWKYCDFDKFNTPTVGFCSVWSKLQAFSCSSSKCINKESVHDAPTRSLDIVQDKKWIMWIAASEWVLQESVCTCAPITYEKEM